MMGIEGVDMELASVIALGNQVGSVISKVMDQLPTRDQRVMEEFYKFDDRLNEEIAREDADYDDLIIWLERRQLLLETIVKSMRGGK